MLHHKLLWVYTANAGYEYANIIHSSASSLSSSSYSYNRLISKCDLPKTVQHYTKRSDKSSPSSTTRLFIIALCLTESFLFVRLRPTTSAPCSFVVSNLFATS